MRPGAPRRGGQAQQRPAQPPSPAVAAAMSGAVDLGALKARNEAAERAKTAPPPVAGQHVIDVSEAQFQTDVLDRSFQVPVLLDLWAEWCQPCKQLSPILEKLANEANGAWVLAKIDVDANPRISQALQVQSIPAVFAVIGGQLVPGFQGLLPEAQVRDFLKAVMEEAGRAGLSVAPIDPPPDGVGEPVEPEVPEDPRFTVAEDALEAGDYDVAAQRYQDILDQEPANKEAQLALGQVRLLQRLESIDQVAAARADTEPDDVDAQLAASDVALASNDIPGALARLLQTVARVAGDDRDRIRQRLLEIFDLLGPDDPRVPPARRELTRALF